MNVIGSAMLQCAARFSVFTKLLVSVGVTETMRSQLQDIIFSCFDEVPMSKNDVILDIGANDGTMLNFAKDGT